MSDCFKAACAAMQGFLSHNPKMDPREVVERSVYMADLLMEQFHRGE